jgi:hypothetical protein
MPAPEPVAAAVRGRINGSVVAPAGYGKTETIADLVAEAAGRCLLLTHTLAGVDALRKRLKEKGVRPDRYQLDTIAAWSLRYVSSYPKTAGFIPCPTPRGRQWEAVYRCAGSLLGSRTLDAVIHASYTLVLVDEYQDCNLSQHGIVTAISRILPTIVFGDPLQGIFDFGGENIVDWERDVLSAFPHVYELETPWRWRNKGNDALARWLATMRERLQAGRGVDLRNTPPCVHVHHVERPELERVLEVRACNGAHATEGNRLAIIGAKASENVRAALAKRVGAQNVETIECKALQAVCAKIEETAGYVRLEVMVRLLDTCMVGVKPTPFLRRVRHIHGGGRVNKPPTVAEAAALRILWEDRLEPLIELIDAFRMAGRLFRGELLFALRESLLARCATPAMTLPDCAWHVQERRRHAGRRHGYKIVTSTLLAKGLEFENTVVFLKPPMRKEDIYVALTRASLRIDIVTTDLVFEPVLAGG